MLRRVLPLLLVIAACSGDDDPTATSTTTSTTSTTAPANAVTASVDWTARTVSVDGTSYGVAFCEGDAPLLCITSPEDEHLGVIEHADFERVPDLEGFAADFAASMTEDRVSHCDPDYELDPDDTTPSTLFGEPGVRYGYTGTIGGSVVERVVAHASIVEDRLHLVTVNFLADEGGCLSRESELPIDTVEDVEPILDAVVAGSTS
jgi:hypothetical protein